jgi:hypothetical protein
MTPFLDRWSREECLFFEKTYSQSNGSFSSLPMLMGGRGRRRNLDPDIWKENTFYRLVEADEIRHRFSFEGYGLHNIYPPGDPNLVSLGLPHRKGAGSSSVRAADCLARVTRAISRIPQGETFYAYIHLMDVHNDLYKKSEANDYGNSSKELYDNNMNYLDRCMREFIGWLKRHGRYENTVIIFTSDHGEEFHEHASTLHGHEFFEESVRVPLILRVPGIKADTIRTGIVTSDITPTLVDLAGYRADPPYDDPTVGISLRDLIIDPEGAADRFEKRDALLIACFKEKYGLLRDFRYKLGYWVTYESFALYDVETDPMERRNIIEEHPELAAEMKEELLRHIRRIRGIEYSAELPWE